MELVRLATKWSPFYPKAQSDTGGHPRGWPLSFLWRLRGLAYGGVGHTIQVKRFGHIRTTRSNRLVSLKGKTDTTRLVGDRNGPGE